MNTIRGRVVNPKKGYRSPAISGYQITDVKTTIVYYRKDFEDTQGDFNIWRVFPISEKHPCFVATRKKEKETV